MALSGLEQRHAPLVNSLPFWKPWGPGRATPGAYPDDEDEIGPELAAQLIAQRVSRSRSWGGYTTYAQSMYLAAAKGDTFNHRSLENQRGRSSTDEPAPSRSSPQSSGKSKKWSDHRPAPIEAVKQVVDRSQSSATQEFFGCGSAPKKKKRGRGSDGSASPSSTASPSGSRSPGSKQTGRSKTSGSRSPGSGSHSPGSNRSAGSRSPVASGPITTLMLRNLPHSLTQADLLDEVDSCGYVGLYDFCYLPHKFAKHKNLGFAFLNFISTEDAAKFRREWHLSRRFGTSLNVSAAAVQGREENEKKAASQKMSRVRNPSYRPMVFEINGQAEACDSESSPLNPTYAWNAQQPGEAMTPHSS